MKESPHERVPPSAEVVAEEIQAELAEGIPREEQGVLIRDYVRAIAEEVAAVGRAWHGHLR